MNFRSFCHLPGLECKHIPERVEGLSFSRVRKGLNSQQPTYWKSVSERMIGYVVPEVDTLMYVVLSKVEK
jgi:hypothetical protein